MYAQSCSQFESCLVSISGILCFISRKNLLNFILTKIIGKEKMVLIRKSKVNTVRISEKNHDFN